ncbi:putative baseplate assembly protein [Kitasatospora sp. NPDC090091]|uniref:putative baseplate assembly protein n=1 Tax=Kitasatospora sp. NPDC090091 TaxID=3364081 RepID=UPI0038231C95
MTERTCGCCERTGGPPPGPVANPPGLPALRLRVGTHPTFLAAMLDRLATADLPGLAGLTTRAADDPAVALCDAWAAVADVLTFYQELRGNEGYLRTAREDRSVHELTRLIGYRPRPGVAAGTHLAFTLEAGHRELIPAGTKVQSLPGPGELPQAYETSAPLPALAAANRLQIRTTRPQVITVRRADDVPELWLDGIATRLKANDLLVLRIATAAGAVYKPRRVGAVEEDQEHRRTRVVLAGGAVSEPPVPDPLSGLGDLVGRLVNASQEEVPLGVTATATVRDDKLRLAELLHPELAGSLHTAWAGTTVSAPPATQVYALRVTAPLFGHNAPLKPGFQNERPTPMEEWTDWDVEETSTVIHLDNAYREIRSGTVAVVEVAPSSRSDGHQDRRGRLETADTEQFTVVGDEAPFTVDSVSRAEYGLSTRTTRITLGGKDRWPVPGTMKQLRAVTVHAAPELLPLAELPITEPVRGSMVELAGLVESLEPGRLLVVSGERADLLGVTGVAAAELVKVSAVSHGPAPNDDPAAPIGSPAPGERNHTFLLLERPLAHRYRRDTVVVHGNVVHATHGETRAEVLGSGDASVAGQRFALRSGPLTHVSAPTPTGTASTLEVTVDAVRWPERPRFLGLGPDDRGYVTETDERDATTVVFPDGTAGRRPPTGTENIRARYRTGIGAAGNTAAGRITLLATKPLGVRDVVNPVPATGGTDSERPDQARVNALLPLKTFDRLVSLTDYADFARAFAGVGKAAADRLSDGRGGLVVVTVTGADGAVLDRDSDVVADLRTALRRYGDPSVRIQVLPAERLVLGVRASVGLLPDHEWSTVEPRLRAALLDAFDPTRRELAQQLTGSEVVAVLQAVPGVRFSRFLRLRAVGAHGSTGALGGPPGPWLPALGARRGEGYDLLPAQHLCAAAELPELLDLKEDAA